MSILFVGGWATEETQFPRLASISRFLVPFNGFSSEELPALVGGGGNILIGWSTGAHMLLKECSHLFSSYDHVLLIAPFLSFIDSFPERLVRRMIAGMDKNPAEVVQSFHKNCAEEADLNFDPAQVPVLIEGLEYLIKSRVDVKPEIAADNLILIHADDDRIVRQKAFDQVLEKIPGAEVRLIDGGHKISESTLLNIIEGL
ncbi:alpha/beta hydrolase [Maridesulfovibrio zosterae]|uniref:alpha/beta hydrolase n=1 Tax=Maridesulfovibrio zosterae TaxID=82171 RepID=UPI0003F9D22C|nr:alpha/beta hydrolase [Maridesulfovibrio zosterae]